MVKSTGCSSRGPKFNSQQPHGGSQPSVMRSGALFWPAGTHAGPTLYTDTERWWHLPLILALGRQRQAEFKASLVYRAISRTARAVTQKNTVSKKKQGGG